MDAEGFVEEAAQLAGMLPEMNRLSAARTSAASILIPLAGLQSLGRELGKRRGGEFSGILNDVLRSLQEASEVQATREKAEEGWMMSEKQAVVDELMSKLDIEMQAMCLELNEQGQDEHASRVRLVYAAAATAKRGEELLGAAQASRAAAEERRVVVGGTAEAARMEELGRHLQEAAEAQMGLETLQGELARRRLIETAWSFAEAAKISMEAEGVCVGVDKADLVVKRIQGLSGQSTAAEIVFVLGETKQVAEELRMEGGASLAVTELESVIAKLQEAADSVSAPGDEGEGALLLKNQTVASGLVAKMLEMKAIGAELNVKGQVEHARKILSVYKAAAKAKTEKELSGVAADAECVAEALQVDGAMAEATRMRDLSSHLSAVAVIKSREDTMDPPRGKRRVDEVKKLEDVDEGIEREAPKPEDETEIIRRELMVMKQEVSRLKLAMLQAEVVHKERDEAEAELKRLKGERDDPYEEVHVSHCATIVERYEGSPHTFVRPPW